MAAKKEKGLPKTLYIYMDTDAGEPYLMACERIEDCVDGDPKRRVGVYKLDVTGYAVQKVEFVK